MIIRPAIVAFYTVLIFSITGCQSSDNSTSAVPGDPVNGQRPPSGNAPTTDNLNPPVVDGLSDNPNQTPDRAADAPDGYGDLELDSDYLHLLTSIAGEPLENLAIDVLLIGDTVPSSANNSELSKVKNTHTYEHRHQYPGHFRIVGRQRLLCGRRICLG